MKAPLLFLTAAALCCAGHAAAQPVFKSTMPDGKIVYGEKPMTGASKVDKMEPPPAKTGVSGLTEEERTRAAELAKQRAAAAASSAQAQKSTDDARAQLQKAEAALKAGKEPLPTERAGIAGGGSRLNEAYFARQKQLEEAVAAARKRLADSQR